MPQKGRNVQNHNRSKEPEESSENIIFPQRKEPKQIKKWYLMKQSKTNHSLKCPEGIQVREKEIEIALSNQKGLEIWNIEYSKVRKEQRSEKSN